MFQYIIPLSGSASKYPAYPSLRVVVAIPQVRVQMLTYSRARLARGASGLMPPHGNHGQLFTQLRFDVPTES